jgi:microcystin degradation protein MlrC
MTHGPWLGIIGHDVFEACQRQIIDALRGMGDLDGVFFSLHGAAVAEAPYTDAEGVIIRAARELLGDTLPMVATYDFHAISSRWENEQGAVPFPHDTNPHIDAYEQGLEAARCMVKMLDGSWTPCTRRLFVPIIGPNIGQVSKTPSWPRSWSNFSLWRCSQTGMRGPTRIFWANLTPFSLQSTWSQIPEQEQELLLYQLNQKRAALEGGDPDTIINISILGGYGYGDSADAGMSIVVTTDDDEALALQLCRELGQEQPGATRSFYTVVGCHWLSFLRDLHTNLAVIAVTCKLSKRKCRPWLGRSCGTGASGWSKSGRSSP